MENINMISQMIFLFMVTSAIFDVLSLAVNYIFCFTTSLINDKNKFIDVVSITISIITNIISLYFLALLLKDRVIQAVFFSELDETTYIILACALLLYRAIMQFKKIENEEGNKIINRYKLFYMCVCVPLFLVLYYFKVNFGIQCATILVSLFYKIIFMPVLGVILRIITYGISLAIIIHMLIIFSFLMLAIKKKTTRY